MPRRVSRWKVLDNSPYQRLVGLGLSWRLRSHRGEAENVKVIAFAR